MVAYIVPLKEDEAMIDITDREFNSEVLECELPVFACFTTEGCHVCYTTCLLFNELASDYDGNVKFVRVDVEKSPEIAERYRAVAVPTIFLFQDSQIVKKLVGFQERDVLRQVLDSLLD